jgi:hypothetical protein
MVDQPPSKDRQAPEISQLQRREIQASIAGCLIRGYAAVMGDDQAVKIATAAIQSDAAKAGETIAAKLGGNTMKDLGVVVKEIWAEGNAITIQMLEETDQALCFNVTRCRYAEFYQKEGMLDLGYCLSCSRDEAFARGFNPRIRLTRTQTIMQGSPVCDFRFALEGSQTTE